jgi:hypothetical protein
VRFIAISAMSDTKLDLMTKLRDLVQGLAHAHGCSAEQRLLLAKEEIRYTRQIAKLERPKASRQEAVK